MNILLLGATGYLGTNIANRLSIDGHNLICVVRNTSNTKRLEQMKVKLISNELNEIEFKLKYECIDWIINGVCTYKSNETLYGDLLNANIIFPLSVLNLAVKYKVKNFATMGTSLPENLNLYSFSKTKFAQFGELLSKETGINFANLQLEMFYGGLFEPDDRFISSCSKKLINGTVLELTEGYQKRDMIRVEDITNIVSALVCSNYVKGYKNLPVGTGQSYSIREIIEFMKDILESNSELRFGAIPCREGEPNTCADTSWYKEIEYKLIFDFWDG